MDESGFAAMGKPISGHRRSAAYDLCVEFGLKNEDGWDAVGKVANALERDKPYEAMELGRKYLDLTGTYRLMSVLLTA